MRNVGNPIIIQILNRGRGPKPQCQKTGQIRNVSISNVVMTGEYPETFQATRAQFLSTFKANDLTLKRVSHPLVIAGQPDSPVKNVSFSNIIFSAHGGGTEEDRNIQLKEVRDGYPGSDLFGEKYPVYGLFAMHVDNLRLYNTEFTTELEDKRDDILLVNVANYKRV